MKATLDEEKTVQQNISDYDMIPINGQPRHVIGYLQDFLFAPERSRSVVKYPLRWRTEPIASRQAFHQAINLLVLDEPTNDLDVETLELLESLLVEYQGTVLLVGHDRAFLNGVATSILAIEPDGRVKDYDGGYDDYLRQRSEQAPTETKSPSANASPSSAPLQREKPKKLSFKERQELESLPLRIEKLETEIQQLHEAMAEPAFYKPTAPPSLRRMPCLRSSKHNSRRCTLDGRSWKELRNNRREQRRRFAEKSQLLNSTPQSSPTAGQQYAVECTIGLTSACGRITTGRVDHELNSLRALRSVGCDGDHVEPMDTLRESVDRQLTVAVTIMQ